MGFTRRCTVVVQSGQVTGTLTDFPVLIYKISNDLKTIANGGYVADSNGRDIRVFSDAALTVPIPFNFVYYDGALGTFIAYAKIGSLAAGSTYYLGFGDAALTTDASSTSTWKSEYKCVLHFLAGGAFSAADSTSNANDFTNANATADSGLNGPSAAFNGTNAKLTRSGLLIPTSGYLSFWWKPNVAATNNRVAFLTYHSTGPKLFSVQPYSDGHTYAGWYNAGTDKRANWTETGISAGTFYHLALVWTNGGTTSFCLNGVQKATTSSLSATWDTSGKTSAIGWDEGSNAFANINVQQFRLMDAAQSIDWIVAEYNMTNNTGSFASYTFDAAPATPGPIPLFLNQYRRRRG